ncbi:hypothetical protein [Psychroserpens sp.]
MKHLLVFISLTIAFSTLNAQVGIGTTTPDPTSVLDITSTDKGVLVPRVNLTDVTNLTTPINTPATGLLIWNTNASVTGGNGIGFYFFNSAQWMPIMENHIDDADFFESGTTNVPNDINDNIFHTGSVSIGVDAIGPKVTIQDNTNDTEPALKINRTSTSLGSYAASINSNITTTGGGLNVNVSGSLPNGRSAYGTVNDLTNVTGTGVSNMSGVRNIINSNTEIIMTGVSNSFSGTGNSGKIGFSNGFWNSANGELYGLSNTFNAASNSLKYGTYNVFAQSSGGTVYGLRNDILSTSSTNKYGVYNKFGRHNPTAPTVEGTLYGVYNYFDPDITANTFKYGNYTKIPASVGGLGYGIYSDVTGATSFAGYFLGRVSVGATVFDTYILPLSRGTNNQIMQTDSVGNVSWVDTSTFSSDDQNLTGANLSGTNLQIDIENGTSTSVDLSSISHWSKTGTDLDVATVADDINFSSDQTSITFPGTLGTPSSMIYMFNGGSSNSNRMVFSHSETYDDWGLQYNDSVDAFRFIGGSADRVTINLGVGNPLVVNGSAQATDFISSTTTYPDYVFESYFDGTSKLNEHYAFKPLNEIEAYIKKNGHLPGVRSYKSVKENGMSINLSETTIINLEKIEELFLYTIELKKENNSLKENQKQLEERFVKIEALLLKMN